jgi:hypothetical protein
MPKQCENLERGTAIVLSTRASPCPWPLGASAQHWITVKNNRPTSIHQICVLVKATGGSVLLNGKETRESNLKPITMISKQGTAEKYIDIKSLNEGDCDSDEISTTITFIDA